MYRKISPAILIDEDDKAAFDLETRNVVEYAIKSLKDKRATGPNEIPFEILKLIDSNNVQILVKLFHYI